MGLLGLSTAKHMYVTDWSQVPLSSRTVAIFVSVVIGLSSLPSNSILPRQQSRVVATLFLASKC